MHHDRDRLQHLEIPSTNRDTFPHCDSHIPYARPTVSGSVWHAVPSCRAPFLKKSFWSHAMLPHQQLHRVQWPCLKSTADHTQNGCLCRMVASRKRHCVLFMPLILGFLSQKVSICPKRRGSTEGPLSELRSPDEICEEQHRCQQTVFRTRSKRECSLLSAKLA